MAYELRANDTFGHFSQTTASTNVSVITSHAPLVGIPVNIAVVLAGSLLSFVTIAGNLLVMISFARDKRLQTISNYFLISLAVADMAIGCISIPLMTHYASNGGWTLGYAACQFWLSIDYMMSNASVCNLLLICLDRYLSLTRPLTYRPRRTKNKAVVMIGLTFFVSLLLWPPWIIAWPYIEGRFTVPPSQCSIQFLETSIYVTILTACLAFYLPVTVMIVLYARVYFVTRTRRKEIVHLRADRKKPEKEAKTGSSTFAANGTPSRSKVTDDDRYGVVCNGQRATMCTTRTSMVSSAGTQNGSDCASFAMNNPVECPAVQSSIGKRLANGAKVVTTNLAVISQLRNKWFYPGALKSKQKARVASNGSQSNEDYSLDSVNSSASDDWNANPIRNSTCHYKKAVPHQQGKRPMGADNGENLKNCCENKPALISTSSSYDKRGCNPMHLSVPSTDPEFTAENSSEKIFTAQPELASYEDKLCSTFNEHSISRQHSAPPGTTSSSSCLVKTRLSKGREISQVAEPIIVAQIKKTESLSDVRNCYNAVRESSPIHSETVPLDASPFFHKKHGPAAEFHSKQPQMALLLLPSNASWGNGSTEPAATTAGISVSSSMRVRHSLMDSSRSTATNHNRSSCGSSVFVSNDKKKSEKRQERKAAKTLSAILLAFIITWTPYNVFVIIEALAPKSVPVPLYTFSYYLCYINSTVNPICYALCNALFRKNFLKILSCQWKSSRRTQHFPHRFHSSHLVNKFNVQHGRQNTGSIFHTKLADGSHRDKKI